MKTYFKRFAIIFVLYMITSILCTAVGAQTNSTISEDRIEKAACEHKFHGQKVATFGAYLGGAYVNPDFGIPIEHPAVVPLIGIQGSYGIEAARFYFGIGLNDMNMGITFQNRWAAADIGIVFAHYKRVYLMFHVGPKVNLMKNQLELKAQLAVGTGVMGHMVWGGNLCILSKFDCKTKYERWEENYFNK